jgi:outer membrane protein insertion porin family
VLPRILLGVVVALAVAGVVLLWVLWEEVENQLRHEIETRVSRKIDGQLRIGELHVTPFPLRVEVRDLELRVPAEGRVLLQGRVDHATARVPLSGVAALAGGRIRLSSVEATGPSFELDQEWVDLRKKRKRKKRRVGIDLRIDRLGIRDGIFWYGRREIPFEVLATEVAFDGSWSPYRQSLGGEIAFSTTLAGGPIGRAWPVSVRAGLRAQETRLDFFDVAAEGPGAKVALKSLKASWSNRSFVTGTGSVDVDLGVFGDWLRDGLPEVAGEVRGEFRFSQAPGLFQVRSEATAGGVRFGPLVASSAQASVFVDKNAVRLSRLRADAYGGTVTGEVDVTIKGDRAIALDLEGEGLDLAPVLVLANVPLPLAGRTSVDLTFRGPPNVRQAWNGGGSARVEAEPPTEDALPAAGDFEFTIVDGRLDLVGSNVVTVGAVSDLRLDTDLEARRGVLDVRGETPDASVTQAGTLRLLEALEIDPGEIVARPLTGAGTFEARTGFGAERSVEIDLDLRDGAWSDQRFRSLDARFSMAGNRLSVSRFLASGSDWSLDAAMGLDLERQALDEIRLQGTGVPLRPVLVYLGYDTDLVEGRLNGNLDLSRGPLGLEGAGRLELERGRILGEPLDGITATVQVSGDVLHAEDVHVSAPAGHVAGRATVDLAAASARFDVRESSLDVAALRAVSGTGVDVGCVLGARGELSWQRDGVRGLVDVTLNDVRVSRHRVGPGSGTVELHPGGVRARLGADDGRSWQAEGAIDWDEVLTSDATLRFDGLRFDLLDESSEMPGWVRLSGSVTARGALSRPGEMRVDGAMTEVDLRLGTRRMATEGEAPVGYANGRVRLGPARFTSRYGGYLASLEYDLATGEMKAALEGAADLANLSILFPGTRAAGRVDVDLDLAGPPGAPRIHGTVAVGDGRMRLLGFPHPIHGIELEARFEGEEALIDRFEAVLGGGEIHGSGGMMLDRLLPDSYRLEVAGANVRIDYPEGFRGVYEGTLLVRGDAEEALLSGDLTMLRGLYSKDFELLRLMGGGQREYSARKDVALPVDLYYDLDFRAEDNVWVRNDLADLESGFALHVGGKYEKPEVTGRLILLEGGELEFREVTYRIETGTLDFVDLERIDPYMSIQARTEVQQYEIRLRIEGTADRFEYELTSNPSLSPQDIIALLTTGKTLEDLADPTTGSSSAQFTGDVAGSYFAGALTAPFERQLEKALGLSRFSINPLLVGSFGDPTARVTVGKEVVEDVTILYSVDLGNTENQFYQLQWKASRKLGFNVERATTGSNAGDVLYLTRFWLKKPPTVDHPPSGGALLPAVDRPLHGSTVDSVRLEGVAEETAEDLLREIPLKEGEPFSRSTLYQGTEALRRYYVKRDRIAARITSSAEIRPDGQVDVTYRAEPGPLYRVEIAGVGKKDRKRIRRRLEALWSESMFAEFLMEDSRDLIEEYFRDRGYYTVDVFVLEGEDDEGPDAERTIRFQIDAGEKVVVRTVEIVGNESISRDRIRDQILTRPSSAFATRPFVPDVLEDDVTAVRNLYVDEGFLAVEVQVERIGLSADGREATITVRVVEGEQFTIGAVTVPDDVPFSPDEMRSWCGLNAGQIFSPRHLQTAESSLRAALDSRGYPEARVGGRWEEGEDTVTVIFQVIPGPQLRVARVQISGNHLTRDKIITRELLIEPGDLISREKILRTQHQLYRLGIFRNVNIDYVPAPGDDPSMQIVRVQVEDAAPLGTSVGAGYDTEAGPRVSVSISHDNVWGYDRSLLLQGRYSSLERRAQLLAREPRLFTRKWPALFSFLWEEEEAEGFTQRRRSTAFRVDRQLSARWHSFARYNFQRVDLLDVTISEDELRLQKLEDLRLGDLGYSVVYDSRDDPFMTRRGKLGSLETRLFAPALFSDASVLKTMFKGGWTVPVGKGHILGTALRIGAAEPFSDTPQVPISERFFAGGESTVRGFPLDRLGPKDDNGIPIGGEGLFIFNQEWRYPVWRNLRGVVFYDAGNVWVDASEIDLLDLRHVLGAGFRLNMPIGPIRIEYGRKLDREEGESAGELFFAIGLVL